MSGVAVGVVGFLTSGVMTKLSQIVAIEKGIKNDAHQAITAAHHGWGKPALLSGISRTYRPLDDEGEELPAESTRVQLSVEPVIEGVSDQLEKLWDVTATKDFGNCGASADLVVDGVTLMENVPVPFLLFLEKQLDGLESFVKGLPVLDPAEEWTWDVEREVWRTASYDTMRSKKVLRNHVLSKATDRHPEQVQAYQEDVPVGRWTTVKFSGAVPAVRVKKLLGRVQTLKEAVKFAREAANGSEVTARHNGGLLLTYLLSP